MDQNTMLILGVVKIINPKTKETKLIEASGFDVLGFFFPFLRYLFDGQFSRAALTFLVMCTVIGWPIMSWLTGFNFKKNRLKSYLSSGWEVAVEKSAA